jgi:hypothetical protein
MDFRHLYVDIPEGTQETHAAHETHLIHPRADLINRAGLPTATLGACISRFTTEPAPMEHPWPMVTPAKIVTLAQSSNHRQ